MSMTQLQRDAMTRAQHGDWRLADAMELQARRTEEHDGKPLAYGLLENGRMRWLVWSEPTTEECGECEGSGKDECGECGHAINCAQCDGSGEVPTDYDGDEIVTDLNKTVVEGAGWAKAFTFTDAHVVMTEYRDQAAPAVANIDPGNPIQTPLIPENFQCA